MRERLAELGLDDPFPVQYARWLGNLVQGQLGRSLSQGLPVGTLIVERLPATLLLSGAALLLTLAIGLPLGVLSAIKRNGLVDLLVTGFAFFGMSVPVFWLGILLILLFSVQLGAAALGRDVLARPAVLGGRPAALPDHADDRTGDGQPGPDHPLHQLEACWRCWPRTTSARHGRRACPARSC